MGAGREVEVTEGWKPAPRVDSIALARDAMKDSKTGTLVLRRRFNQFLAVMLAVGTLLIAVIGYGPGALRREQVPSVKELVLENALWVGISLVCGVIWGRSFVRIRGSELTIQNPLRRYVCLMDDVISVELGYWGAPKLELADRWVTIAGLPMSVLESMRGGSLEFLILTREIADHSQRKTPLKDGAKAQRELEPDSHVTKVLWRPPGVGLSLLLMGWVLHGLSFIVL